MVGWLAVGVGGAAGAGDHAVAAGGAAGEVQGSRVGRGAGFGVGLWGVVGLVWLFGAPIYLRLTTYLSHFLG